MIQRIKNWYTCFRTGHVYKKQEETVGGNWVMCLRCNKLDEHLPGVHEPKGHYLFDK